MAALLGVHRQTVYAQADVGVIPSRRLGRRRIFLRSEIDAWLGRPAQ